MVLEMPWWCATDSTDSPPTEISAAAFAAARCLVADFFMPMAARVYGDAAATPAERDAATLARWIIRERAVEVHVSHLQRVVKLPGLNAAAIIHGAAKALVEAGWLMPPPTVAFHARACRLSGQSTRHGIRFDIELL